MNVAAYFQRIGYTGTPAVDHETLRAIHRAHLLAIPYENLTIHQGGVLKLGAESAFERLVVAHRGGWCFEMNGLLAWALREIGFSVRLLGAAVNRPVLGERAERNHLALLVELEQPYLADVGFGNGFLEPLPLREGAYRQGPFEYHLRCEGQRWFVAFPAGMGPGFDFTLAPLELAGFAERCHELQTSPDSGFVRLTVCHRALPEAIISMRGAVFSTTDATGTHTETITNVDHYRTILFEQFDLQISQIEELWANVWAAHVAWQRSMI